MQEKVNQYLATLLTDIEPYVLATDEQKKVQRDMPGFIMDKLMRKKFRRFISEDTRRATFKKISNSVKENVPIQLVILFGGYKHFWSSSHPEPDWAEVFHLRWMTEYVLPILAAYKPGVRLEYVSEDLIIPRMNNYPDESLEAYSKAFRDLIAWYSKRIPKNMDINYWRVGDKYDKQAIVHKVEALIPERKVAFAKLGAEEQEQEIHRSVRAVFWRGKEDLTRLTDKEKRDRIIESRIIELAFYDTEGSSEFLGEYYWQDNRICVCFSFGLSPDNDEFGDLTLQCAHGSGVDYWIGRGILKHKNGKFYGTIVSQQQYKNQNVDVVDVRPSLVPLKNCQTIDVLQRY